MCDGTNDCPGGEDEGYNCCTSSNPCGEGKGDCDNDSECQGNLVCGLDNCNTALGFASDMDCCIVKGNFVIINLNVAVADMIDKQNPGCFHLFMA